MCKKELIHQPDAVNIKHLSVQLHFPITIIAEESDHCPEVGVILVFLL